MKTKKFYAVAGCNGVAVMSDYARADQITTYIRCAKIKSFADFAEAESWAVFESAIHVPWGCYIPTPLSVNKAVFFKNLSPS